MMKLILTKEIASLLLSLLCGYFLYQLIFGSDPQYQTVVSRWIILSYLVWVIK